MVSIRKLTRGGSKLPSGHGFPRYPTITAMHETFAKHVLPTVIIKLV